MSAISNPGEILRIALELSDQNRCDEVAALLLQVLEEPWSLETSRGFLGQAYVLLCRAVLASQGHSARAESVVRQLCIDSRRRYGRQPWTDLYEGAMLHLSGEHDAAVEYYRAAAADANILLPLSNGCKTVL